MIVMLVAFMMSGRKFQATTLTVGFSIIVVWAYITLFTPGGVTWMSEGYQQVLQTSMDMEREEFQDWSGFHAMQKTTKIPWACILGTRLKFKSGQIF